MSARCCEKILQRFQASPQTTAVLGYVHVVVLGLASTAAAIALKCSGVDRCAGCVGATKATTSSRQQHECI